MKGLRILLTADAVGGVWTYALELAAGLAQAGNEVTLAVLGPAPSPAQLGAPELHGVEVVDTGLSLDWLADDLDAISRAGRGVAALARSRRADLVHLNSPALAAEARFSARLAATCHSCLASWWKAVRSGSMPSTFEERTRLLGKGYARCDALIAPSAAFASATRALYGVSPTVVPNGRSPGMRRPERRKQPFILTSGRLWDEGKNLAALEKAAARVRWPILAAGRVERPQGGAVTARNVRLLGHLDPVQLDRRLNRAAIYASVAAYEPFGFGVLEAAQSGCALVLSAIPTFHELWSGAAVFVPPNDPVALADVLNDICADDDRRMDLGRRAARRAQRYTRDAMVTATLRAYRSAMRASAA